MELIKQYVDLLIRRQEEALEYQRVNTEWKTLQTQDAKKSVALMKEKMERTENETERLYVSLKEKGLVAGGETPWGTEMMRYATWLSENSVPDAEAGLQKK